MMGHIWIRWIALTVCCLTAGPVLAGQVGDHRAAYQRAVDEACQGRTDGLAIYVSGDPLPAGEEIKTWKGIFLTLDTAQWLVFIDEHPGANWEHSCRFVLVDPGTGVVRMTRGTRPPECLGDMIHMSGPDILGGENVRPTLKSARSPAAPAGRSVEHLWAVILSGGASQYSNYPRYWNDCSSIYTTLVNVYGYLDENIIVAISDGTDPAPDQSNGGNSNPDLDGDGDDDIMFSCIKTNLDIIFADLATNLTSQDSLFIFTTDHGNGQLGVPGQPTSMNLWNGEEIWDYEFAALMEPIQCREFNVVLEPCFSGGFVNDIIEMNSSVPRSVSSAANDHEYSWAMGPDYIYDTYVFHWTAAVTGEDAFGNPVDADTNMDGIVDMYEAYVYAEFMDDDDEHPQYDDWPEGYGSTTSLWGSGPNSEGEVKLDRTLYNCDDTIEITVEDLDLEGQGTLTITIDSTTEPGGESVILTETDTAHFEGTIATGTGTSSPDGILQVDHGDFVTATYEDDNYGGQGPMTLTDQSTVDCLAPVISNVHTDDMTYQSATVYWTTDEPATSRVEYGIDMGLGTVVESTEPVTDHAVLITGLDDCTTYYFKVLSTDQAGNQAEDDNGGLMYSFQTWEVVYQLNETLDSNPGWTISGGQWAFGQPTGGGGAYGGPDPTGGYTGTNVYGYNLNGDYANNIPEYNLTTTVIDCSDAEGVIFGFRRWLGVERNFYDHAAVRISTDGSTWTTIWANPDAETADTAWVYQEFDVSAYADHQSTVYFRWVMGTTDGGWTYCGWNIDDVIVYYSNPCGEPTSTPPATCTPTTVPTGTPPPATHTPAPPTHTPAPPTDTPAPPTDTPVPPTNTMIPTNTQIPTYTSMPPTDTPAPPTDTPVPPTETPSFEKGMVLMLDDTDLTAGDRFYLHMNLNNPEPEAYQADAYVLLGIWGDYWFWPSWIHMSQGLDSQTYSIPSGTTPKDLLDFTWPGNVGQAGNLEFIGCLFRPGSWNMIGSVQYINWSYH
ncbi:hypothetical protein JXA40_02465 [bacterium]|nr:hypothetical protein [candidate division CSSED10-310 bacterium]